MTTIKDLDGQTLNLEGKMVIVEKSGSFMVEGADDNFKIIQEGKTMIFGDKVGELISKLFIQRESLDSKNLSEPERFKIVDKIEKLMLVIVISAATIKKRSTNVAYVVKSPIM